METEQNATEPDKIPNDIVDLKITSLLIENPSLTDQEIADQIGVSRQTINRRKNSPEVKGLIHSALSIPQQEVRRLTAKALRRLEELLDHEDAKVRLAATLSLVKLTDKLMSKNMSIKFDSLIDPLEIERR